MFNDLKSYKNLSQALADSGGVASVMMWQLRQAHGASRLGVNVVAYMEEGLENAGIGVYPELTLNQNDQVRIYQKNTAAGRMMTACLTVGEDQDEKLKRLSSGDSEKVIRKIKELVCD